MSAFYDLASLVLVPSGYKASKVYAQKPLTTDGQLTFSRASTATRVNSAGLIETVSSNVPRLDYLNSSCPRLLLEPQRTNIITFSEDLTNAFYFKNNCTIAANSVISPDGFQNADTATFTSGGNFGYFFSFAGNSSVAFSFFVKKGNYTSLNVLEQFYFATSITFNLDAKTATAGGKVEDYGNGWLRCSWVQAYGAGQTAIAWQFSEAAGAAGFAYFYGFQVEAGAYATSYIPTLGAAVTRGDELATKTSASALIGQTEGTLFLEFDFVVGEQANYGLIYNAGFSTYIYMNQQVSGSIFGQVQPFDISFSVAKPNGRYKCALAYKSGSSAFFVNGVQVGTTNTTTFSPSAMDIFSFLNGDNTKGIRQALLFKTRLTNAQLAELTSL